MSPYLVFFIFLLAVLGVVGAVVALNALLGPRLAPSEVKLEPFECGSRPVQRRNTRPLSIKYYPVAILFLIFDVETVLLFIWAQAAGKPALATLSLCSLLFFMGVLAAAFVYLWKEGCLEWR